ncbi:MAG: lactonase family protein [Bacteroidota bacterium]
MKWNKPLLIALVLSNLTACANLKKGNTLQEIPFFVGTSTNLPTEGIYAYTLNSENGSGTFQSKTENIINPSFLAIHPNNQFVYALERKERDTENQVKAYAINSDQSLRLLNQQSTKGSGACYISVGKSGENVMIAHYGSGSIASLPINTDGSLNPAKDIIQHQGSSIYEERQKGPHAHYIKQGVGNLIYAADLGIDKVMLYQLKNGELVANQPTHLQLPLGAGPRHLSYHPNGKFVYVMNEMGGSVSVFSYNNSTKTFTLQQTISSLPAGFKGYNKSADIHVHPSGKFLYASNRGDYDSIAAFKINAETGQLSVIEIEQETIVWPRNFAISPNGKYLLCANLKDDSISIFKVNQKTGALDFTGEQIVVLKPLCIQFFAE